MGAGNDGKENDGKGKGVTEKLAKQGLMFFLISTGVTVVQFLILKFLPELLGPELAAKEAMWPPGGVRLTVLGTPVRWCLVGAEVLRDSAGNPVTGGGLGAAIAAWAAPFAAQLINFPLQRTFTFHSSGNVARQAGGYFAAWVLISLVSGGITNLIKPVLLARFGFTVFSAVQTVLIGGVSMVVMFFVLRIIFNDKERSSGCRG